MSGKFALIIGNTEYTDPGLAQLTAPGKDAEDFARVLKDKEIGAFDSVNVLVNESSASVIEAVDEFFDQKKPDDLLVLYFSGHGIRDEIGSLYLAFKNTIRSRLRSTAIKSDYIKEAMDQSRSKRQVLILDCCNSGAFPQGTKAELGGAMGMTSAFQGYGRFVLTASDATQLAWEGDKVIGNTDNSLFTHFLVKGLEGEADSDGDGRITVDELYDYAYQEISTVTPKQTPTKSASKVEGEIVLRQSTRIEDIKPISLSDQLVSEIENPYPEVRLRAIGQLAKLVTGKNLGLARSAREALERIKKEDDSNRVVIAAKQALEAANPLENLITPKIEEESSQSAKKKVEEDPITQSRKKTESRATADVEQERLKAIQIARQRERLERQSKLQPKPTVTARPEKKVKQQGQIQQSVIKTVFGLGGIAVIILVCISGSIFLWRNFPIAPLPSNSPTPTIEESTPTLSPLPTDTAFIPPTTVPTREASPTPTKTNILPQLFLPGNISREGDTIGGSVISYQASATDAEDGPLAVDCVPRSGSLFSVGSTIVNCLAMDSQGAKTTELFSIIVNDTTAPAIDPHGDVNIQATSDSGTIVTYTNPVTYDIVDGQGTAICLRQSGNLFNIGDTSVTCTATDSHGNSASTSFVVHVIAPPTPVSNSSILVLVYWDKDKDGRHDSSDYLLSATLKLYAGTSCTGTAIASPIAFLGYKFDHLEAGTYCVKVNSVEDVGTCALIPGKYGNTNVYPDLTENEDREDLDSGFPYVCQ